MKLRLAIITVAVFTTASLFGQSHIEKLYAQKRYAEVIAFAPKASTLSGPDVFAIGQAYLMQKDDANALLMFNQALEKGFKNGEIYFARGVAQSNLKLYKEAEQSYRQALFYLPGRKKVMIELAANYYKAENLDSAYAVYARIEKNWGDYYPAVLMTCQILQEQERYAKALDCYYTKLPILRRSPEYHKEALEEVVRLEWHQFANYPKTEMALKNLMDAYPANYEYPMQLMQLYNFTGRYADAMLLENSLVEAYKALKLPQAYYQQGVMIVEQWDSASYHFEAYRNFQPEKDGSAVYKTFVFSVPGNRPLGKIVGQDYLEEAFLRGYGIDSAQALPPGFSYEGYKLALLDALFAPKPAPADSTFTE